MFRVVWGFDALIAAVFLVFFVIGLGDGTVSSFNMGLWLVTLTCLAVVLGGSLKLRSMGMKKPAMMLALLLGIPGLLVGLFFLALIVLAPDWR